MSAKKTKIELREFYARVTMTREYEVLIPARNADHANDIFESILAGKPQAANIETFHFTPVVEVEGPYEAW